HARAAAEIGRRVLHDAPAVAGDLHRPPAVIRQVEIDGLLALGGAQMQGDFRGGVFAPLLRAPAARLASPERRARFCRLHRIGTPASYEMTWSAAANSQSDR